MKQKYKVFINDQEIVFQQKSVNVNTKNTLMPSGFKPVLLYRELAQKNLDPGTYVVESNDPESEFINFIGQFKTIEAAGGIVRKDTENGDLLLIFRLGKWDLPKGKIDKGESPETAAVREVEEECGISGLIIKNKVAETFHMYEAKGKVIVKKTFWFAMITSDKTSPTPQENEGISQVKWMNELEVKKILPAAYTSISKLIQEKILNS